MNPDNFWNKVDVGEPGDCWLWTACKNKNGYGQLRVSGKGYLATHIALELAGIPRPAAPGNRALHSDACVSRACVNPSHLRWGTQAENMADMNRLGRLKLPRLSGANHPMATLDLAAVEDIRSAPKVNGSGRALARKHGVTEGTIWRIRSGSLWSNAA